MAPAVAARRDAALLLLGFCTAARRSELVVLTVADVTVHPPDGLHVRIARSKTDQDAVGAVRAVPYGRETLTCAACAVLRWRTMLDTADEPRPAVMAAARRLSGADRLHICTDEHPEPVDPARPLFPTVHKTGVIYRAQISGHAVNHVLARRAAPPVSPRLRSLGSAGIRCGPGSSPRRSGPAAESAWRPGSSPDPPSAGVRTAGGPAGRVTRTQRPAAAS